MNKDINNLQKLYESQEQSINVDDWDEIPERYTGHVKRSDGAQNWYENGELHREDGPAVIYNSGTQKWYKNGELHREDGPAVINPDGTQEWYLNGKYHREDGPAIVMNDDDSYWYLNNKQYSKDEYWRELYKRGKITQEELFVELL